MIGLSVASLLPEALWHALDDAQGPLHRSARAYYSCLLSARSDRVKTPLSSIFRSSDLDAVSTMMSRILGFAAVATALKVKLHCCHGRPSVGLPFASTSPVKDAGLPMNRVSTSGIELGVDGADDDCTTGMTCALNPSM